MMENNSEFDNEKFLIGKNYGDTWVNNAKKHPYNFILIRDNIQGECLELSLSDAKFMIDSLEKIVKIVEGNPIKINNKVKIISGRFKGLEGVVTDIDECDNLRPIAIRIIEYEMSGTIYVNYDEVEKLS